MANSRPLIRTGRPWANSTVTSSGSIVDRGVPERDAHDRRDDLHGRAEQLEALGLVGGAPDVGVGRVRLLGGVAVGQVALLQPGRHLVAPPELGDERPVQPRLVDPQVRVGEQAVAVEPLDVVALEGRPVAPDEHVVVAHGAHEQGADDGPAQRGGVEVGLPGGADVEGAAGQGGQSFLDQRRDAVDEPRLLGAVGEAAAGDGVEIRLVVLPDVGGVGVGERAVLAHPRHGDGGVQATRERDPDPLADRELAEDLRHAGQPTNAARPP